MSEQPHAKFSGDVASDEEMYLMGLQNHEEDLKQKIAHNPELS